MTPKTPAQRAREYRARKRGGSPREPAPCGTRAAAERHRRNGESLCGACVAAEREYMAAKQRERRDKQRMKYNPGWYLSDDAGNRQPMMIPDER